MFWQKIRSRQLEGLKFRRQHSIGPYIADFYCPDHQLVIEIDGDVHYFDNQQKRDTKRTHYIESLGYTVLRFTNDDIRNNMDGVADKILLTLTLSSRGEGTSKVISSSNLQPRGEGTVRKSAPLTPRSRGEGNIRKSAPLTPRSRGEGNIRKSAPLAPRPGGEKTER